MSNVVWWAVFGAAAGFWRAWKKTAVPYARSIETLKSIPTEEKALLAEGVGYTRGLRSAALIVYTIVGGAVGAGIWLLASTLTLLSS